MIKAVKEMRLDKNAFLCGNIKPDLSPQCLRNPLQNDIEYAFLTSFRACMLIFHLSQTAAEDSAAV